MDEQTFKRWLREVLDEGTGYGLSSWAATSATTLSVAQQTLNAVNATGGGVTMTDVPPQEPEPQPEPEPEPDE